MRRLRRGGGAAAMHHGDVTLCMTMGLRPDHLRQTLESLFSYNSFAAVIGVNDFRDRATSRVFKSLCPNATLLVPERQVGHHRAVDWMYEHVRTPYVMHCEDDWLFDPDIRLGEAHSILDGVPDVSVVSLRKREDLVGRDCQIGIQNIRAGQLSYWIQPVSMDPDWGSFTFNPSLLKKELWQQHGPYVRFALEVDISQYFKSRNMAVALLSSGVCVTTGAKRRTWDIVRNHPLNKLKRSLRKRYATLSKLFAGGAHG
jgi:hypothetical protein